MISRGCELTVVPAGVTVDVNSAAAEQLRRGLLQVAASAETADSLVDALLDWRDADDIARPLGAEREWYVSQGLIPPPNRPFADGREFTLVRGFASLGRIDTLLGVEPSLAASRLGTRRFPSSCPFRA
jgi:general secretion pathway protein K